MTVAATSSTAWKLVSFVNNVEVREDPTDPDADQKRSHAVMHRKREHQEVTAFTPLVGNTDTELSFSNGGTDLKTAAGTTYVLITHTMNPSTEGSDLWTEEQVSESYEAWAAMPAEWIN